MHIRNNQTAGTRGLRAALPVICILGTSLFVASESSAGTFRIAPTLGAVPAEKSTATFQLHNTGVESLTVQVQGFRWSQVDNANALEPADDLIVVPPLVSIPAGQTQIIRIARKHRDDSAEGAYRVHFQEIPGPPPTGFVGLQTALKLNVPLFFLSRDTQQEIEWSIRRTDTQRLVLQARNTGTRFARFSKIALREKNGNAIATVRGPVYALAGAQREWEFDVVDTAVSADELNALVVMESVRREIPLTVE